MKHKTNPSWLAVKALHNMTISSDQWFDVFGNIVVATPGSEKKGPVGSTSAGTATPPGAAPAPVSSPIVSNGKRSLGNGDASSYNHLRASPSVPSASKSTVKASAGSSKLKNPPMATVTSPPLPPLPEPGPFNVHITALEIPVLYEAVLDIIPGLHLKPPKLPTDSTFIELPPDFPPAPESGYDFIFHIGVAGRGPLRMEIIGHKFGYNMKDASGNYCAIVPPPSTGAKNNINATRGPGAHPPAGVGPAGAIVPSGVHYNLRGPGGGGFGSMGMGYNNERLGYNPAVHDPQPAIPGTENSVRPVRGFGTAYESFPDEMMTDIDVTRLVQDLKASGITVSFCPFPFMSNAFVDTLFALYQQIYTSMDAGHYLCDFIYYCSLAESKRSSKLTMPYMSTNSPYFTPSAQGPYYQSYQGYPGQAGYYQQQQQQQQQQHSSQGSGSTGPKANHASSSSNTSKSKPARVLFMHCPPVKEPLSTEEVTEAIRRIVLWVCRECEIEEIKEKAQTPEEGAHGGGY
ncbi:hypothetical protein CC2G_011959 [Coprinopsis cinerea AmutBmut pab1-1]|nr:hypothetical protein CC2G_011959 [Coprinopsis cinerea AmutBmut pab1-1]